jgi:hypothetical protein
MMRLMMETEARPMQRSPTEMIIRPAITTGPTRIQTGDPMRNPMLNLAIHPMMNPK